jgi:hypothetical protein
MMRERNLAGPRAHAAAGQRRHACGMMRMRGTAAARSARRRRSRRRPTAIIETSSSSDGDSGGRIVGSRAASIDFPEPGGPAISKLCPPAAAISSARFALSWPLMSFRSSGLSENSRIFGEGRQQHLRAAQVIDELQKRTRRHDIHVGRGPCRFRAAGGGADQALFAFVGGERLREARRKRARASRLIRVRRPP